MNHDTPLAGPALAALSQGKYVLILPDGRAFRTDDTAAIVRIVTHGPPPART